jgi:glucosylglycerate synthase
MASTQTNIASTPVPPTGTMPASTPGTATAAGSLLVSLVPLSPEALESMLANLSLAFAGETVLVATPDAAPQLSSDSPLRLLPYTVTTVSTTPWILTAADYLSTYKLAQENRASACVLLGAESQTLHPEAIRALGKSALQTDLTTAHYNLGPREGLVNSAILYPVTRALFGTRPRFPLAIDLGLSLRMAERLATVAQRFTAAGQNDAFLWPLSEAAIAGYSIAEVNIGPRTLPQPVTPDLNTVLTQIAGSLFADVDAKASFWQRARGVQPPYPITQSAPVAEPPPDIASMLEAFRFAYTNLHEIWSLVLPPNSLLGLKKLSLLHPESFRMPDNLWARIVYDFILAYRLRTINRGHLLGALTPLYLAWAASHLTLISSGTAPEKHIQDVAAAFETDKPYLVSRWRWPDRFNP